jgi:hypothetical protein
MIQEEAFQLGSIPYSPGAQAKINKVLISNHAHDTIRPIAHQMGNGTA